MTIRAVLPIRVYVYLFPIPDDAGHAAEDHLIRDISLDEQIIVPCDETAICC